MQVFAVKLSKTSMRRSDPNIGGLENLATTSDSSMRSVLYPRAERHCNNSDRNNRRCLAGRCCHSWKLNPACNDVYADHTSHDDRDEHQHCRDSEEEVRNKSKSRVKAKRSRAVSHGDEESSATFESGLDDLGQLASSDDFIDSGDEADNDQSVLSDASDQSDLGLTKARKARMNQLDGNASTSSMSSGDIDPGEGPSGLQVHHDRDPEDDYDLFDCLRDFDEVIEHFDMGGDPIEFGEEDAREDAGNGNETGGTETLEEVSTVT